MTETEQSMLYWAEQGKEYIKNPPDPTDEVKMFIQEYKAYISKLFEKKVGKSA